MKHILLFFILLTYYTTAYTTPKVVATIKPIHSLVSSVMEGIATPILLIDGEHSIHDYILRPSDARKLSLSNIIFYVDDNLEPFIKNNKNKVLIKLSNEVALLSKRSEYIFSDAEEKNYAKEYDFHIWLNPENAKNIVYCIAKTLSRIDSKNAPTYNANASKTVEKILQYSDIIKNKLHSVKKTPYLVTHDAYQYFEKYFGLTSMAALSQDDEMNISFNTLYKIKKIVKENNIKCLFSEFPENRLNNQLSDKLKIQVLDPIGSTLTPGPNAYFIMMKNVADKLANCLSST